MTPDEHISMSETHSSKTIHDRNGMNLERLTRNSTNRAAAPLTRVVLVAATLAAVALGGQGSVIAQENPAEIERARALRMKLQKGEALTDDEQAEVEERNRARELRHSRQKGETLTADEQAYLDRYQGKKGPVPPPRDFTGMIPLTELGAQTYKGEDGGLYGGGRNEPPAPHRAAAERELARITPLDSEGRPAKDGKIVFLSIGMSNASVEFAQFEDFAKVDPRKSPHVVVVNGAQSGRAASIWVDREMGLSPWRVVEERLKLAGVTTRQVQVAWIKHAQGNPRQLGEFPAHARVLADNTIKTLHLLRERHPNCRVVYLASRIYAGYALTPQNPEPYAYEGAFAMRWIIQAQMKGDPQLNFDPAKGAVKAPAVVWGPYLWTDGVKPRADGLVWLREDLRPDDGSHPSGPPAQEMEKARYRSDGDAFNFTGNDSGRRKVAQLLLDFVHHNPLAARWYLKPTEQ